jgi:hypothetical protein
MKKSTKRWLGGLAIATGAAGIAGAYLKRKNMGATPKTQKHVGNVWARPGMVVTFRAELMPGRDREDRAFLVKEFLPSGRVSLQGFEGEHTETEFEHVD